MAKPGRPMKYRHMITGLLDGEIYSPATIVTFAEEQDLLLLLYTNDDERKHLRLKIRHTMARFTQNHNFPKEGDGLVFIKGQAAVPGWKGKRWKDALQKLE